MNLSEFAVGALLSFSTLIGVSPLPKENPQAWTLKQDWQSDSGHYRLEATNQSIPAACQRQTNGFVEFPVIIHGAHEVLLDGQRIDVFADPSFRTVRSFYGTLVLTCKNLQHGKTLTWRAYSYTRYFARVAFWPRFQLTSPNINFYQETMQAVVAGGLITLALISIFTFWGQVAHRLTISLVGSGIAFAAYFIAGTPAFFNLQASMLSLHKLADFSLWMGTLLLFNSFRVNGLFGIGPYLIYCFKVLIAITIIAIGETGDVIQFGTTIPFAWFFAIMGMGLYNLLRRMRRKALRSTSILQILSLSSFILTSANDVLVVLGLIQGPVLVSIGILAGVAFLALDIHEQITEAYRERDYLRHHLEDEVIKKTAELSSKTNDLEIALENLRVAQADLIQSSKMASLGMLAAGIAHEINNSLNYVNGSVTPLKRLMQKSQNFEYKDQAFKLLQVMNDGLRLTFDIMNSLRTYSGLNQAAVKDHKLLDLVQSTLTIIKNRIPCNVRIELDIPENLEIAVNAAAINQVLMNLIVNALDAIGEIGLVKISALTHGDRITLKIQDDGPGVPQDIRDKVFDPFFTTKDVGKGTGLGLHISRREILKHGGSLGLESNCEQGSVFTIDLPKNPIGEHNTCSQ